MFTWLPYQNCTRNAMRQRLADITRLRLDVRRCPRTRSTRMSGNNPDSRALGVTRGLRECTTTTRKPRPTNRCRGDDEDAQVRERPILPESHSSRLFEILTEPVPHL